MKRPVRGDHASIVRQLAAVVKLERTARDIANDSASLRNDQRPRRVVPDLLAIVGAGVGRRK